MRKLPLQCCHSCVHDADNRSLDKGSERADATGSKTTQDSPQEVVTLNPDYWFSYVTMLVIDQRLCAENNL